MPTSGRANRPLRATHLVRGSRAVCRRRLPTTHACRLRSVLTLPAGGCVTRSVQQAHGRRRGNHVGTACRARLTLHRSGPPISTAATLHYSGPPISTAATLHRSGPPTSTAATLHRSGPPRRPFPPCPPQTTHLVFFCDIRPRDGYDLTRRLTRCSAHAGRISASAASTLNHPRCHTSAQNSPHVLERSTV